MHPARDIVSAVRTVAVWLLVMSVLLGPVGIGSASASGVGSKACGVLCPCDEPQEADCDEHSTVDPDADEAHEHGDESPEDACFDECSGCAPGVALPTAAVPSIPTSASPLDRSLAPSDAPATGVCTGVFRPPRSLG